ncbi:MAG: hypothetical protein CL609_11080 [Anaerolineaceae bacterium]|nr:hypothetical protein [Anaerolineaceae bacterium]
MKYNSFAFLSRWIDPENHFLVKLQNQIVCMILVGLTNVGFSSAIRTFILRLNEFPSTSSIERLYSWVRWVITKSGRDQLWDVYYETRNESLGYQLKHLNRPGSNRSPIPWLFSRLVLSRTENLTKPDETLTKMLWVYLNDPDEQVRNQVIELLKTVNKQGAFQEICDKWIKTRNPSLENLIQTSKIKPPIPPSSNILIYFLRKDLDHPSIKSNEMIGDLVKIFLHEEVRFQEMAGFLLRSLDTQSSINAFCGIWADNRDKQLENLLVQCQYTASSPENVYLLTRLKLNKNLNRVKITPEKVSILIDFLTDPDIEINHQAKLLLTNLSLPESQIAFLEFYISEMPAVLTPLLPLINFKTNRQDLLAMAFFMAEDWQNYELIDFNQQFLSVYFYNADDSTRRNILTKLQRSGKPQFTNILIQNNQSTRQKFLSHAEVQTSIFLLQQYENWPSLWELCQNTYLDLSLTIFTILRNHNWEPQDPTERDLYHQLLNLDLPDQTPPLADVINNIPFAIPISKLRFRGRINDVAFARQEKILAMATNQRAVLLWNYKQGKAEQLIKGFNHSIGLLTYSDNDQLFIGEKTNGQDLCDVWRWSDQRLSLIGFHQGSITSIHSIHNDLLITTGKDKRIVAWNPNTKSAVNETKLGWWPRASFYHTDTKTLSLFNTFRIELSVPEFKYQPYQFVQSNPAVRTSVERDIRVVSQTKEILIGQNNGQIVLNQYNHDKKIYQQVLIQQIPSNLIGLTNTTVENEFMAVGKDGEIYRFDLFGKINSLHHQVSNNFTSFQISPDRTLFATGTKTAETVLWDLRPNQIKEFLQNPISEISNSQWVVLKFIENQKNLEKNTETIIRYCNRLLEHRYKFDIELASIDELSPGEFDIELEQVYGE